MRAVLKVKRVGADHPHHHHAVKAKGLAHATASRNGVDRLFN